MEGSICSENVLYFSTLRMEACNTCVGKRQWMTISNCGFLGFCIDILIRLQVFVLQGVG